MTLPNSKRLVLVERRLDALEKANKETIARLTAELAQTEELADGEADHVSQLLDEIEFYKETLALKQKHIDDLRKSFDDHTGEVEAQEEIRVNQLLDEIANEKERADGEADHVSQLLDEIDFYKETLAMKQKHIDDLRKSFDDHTGEVDVSQLLDEIDFYKGKLALKQKAFDSCKAELALQQKDLNYYKARLEVALAGEGTREWNAALIDLMKTDPDT